MCISPGVTPIVGEPEGCPGVHTFFNVPKFAVFVDVDGGAVVDDPGFPPVLPPLRPHATATKATTVTRTMDRPLMAVSLFCDFDLRGLDPVIGDLAYISHGWQGEVWHESAGRFL